MNKRGPPVPLMLHASVSALPTVSIRGTLIGGHSAEFEAVPNSGAQVSVAGNGLLEHMGVDAANLLPPPHQALRSAQNHKIVIRGMLPVRLTLGDVSTDEKILICDHVDKPLISWRACVSLKILPPNYPCQITSPNQLVNTVSRPDRTSEILDGINAAADVSEKVAADVEDKLKSHYRDVFAGKEDRIPPMRGQKMHIHVDPAAVPFKITTARSIPIAYREAAKAELDALERQGIIERHAGPSQWAHPMVVVPKKNGKVRICVDLTRLNRFVRRPHHPLLSPREAVERIPPHAQYFTTFDATHGYHQVELDEESKLLTVFVTPWGKYRYCRAPQGLSAAGDEYGERTDPIFENLQTIKVVDDILAADRNFRTHVKKVIMILELCRKHRVTLSRDKFCFARRQVDFVGFKVGRQGIAADPEKVAAIARFPRPTSRSDLRSFMGVAVQLAAFTPLLAEAAQPLRDLLKTSNSFCWEDEHETAFDRVKQILMSAPVLAPYDPALPVALHTDASRLRGLGYVVTQVQDGQTRLIQCGSRFITDTERRYAMFELEMLGVVWAAHKAKTILQGRDRVELFTDHKPLVPVINAYTCDKVDSPRMRRLMEKITLFNFHATWKKGKCHVVPDVFSRFPVDAPGTADALAETEVDDHAAAVFHVALNGAPGESADVQLEDVARGGRDDPEYARIISWIESGRTGVAHKDLPPELKPYAPILDELSVIRGVVTLGDRIVVPKSLRKRFLRTLHSAHSGITKMKRTAKSLMYWPGMSADIDVVVASCDKCMFLRPAQPKEPLINTPRPLFPFAEVSTDLCSIGHNHYLVYVDRLTAWLEVAQWKTAPSSAQVIKVLRKLFVALGVPQILSSDNGPQYASSEFADFLRTWHVTHRLSSPFYPRSNGHAEAGVKTFKKLAHATSTDISSDQFLQGLLQWRNESKEDGLSPSERLFGHRLRCLLPATLSSFSPKWQHDQANRLRDAMKTKAKIAHDATAHPLRPLKVGTHVAIWNTASSRWTRRGVIVECGKNRSYLVKLPNNTVLARNRQHLRPIVVQAGEDDSDSQHGSDSDRDSAQGHPTRSVATVPPTPHNGPAGTPLAVGRHRRTIKKPARFRD